MVVRQLSVGFLALLVAAAVATVIVAPRPHRPPPPRNSTAATADAHRLARGAFQLPFISNEGQIDPQVSFYTRSSHGTTYVTTTGALVHQVRHASPAGAVLATVRETLVGGRRPAVRGDTPGVTRVNFFRGSDPSAWRSNVATFARVDLGEVYDGIHVTLAADVGVEKIFTIAPGARVDDVRLRVDAADLAVNDAGELEAATPQGTIRFTRPIAFQEIETGRVPVDASYEVDGDEYGFRVGAYDTSRPLIIDPAIISTYLGGTGDSEAIFDILLDGAGSVYVTGWTNANDFPGVTPGSPDSTLDGCPLYDGFVAKLDVNLTTVEAATFIGGSGSFTAETALAIARNAAGEIYVGGRTMSSDHPGISPGAPDATFAGNYEGFIVRLDANLSTFLSGTFVGGSAIDQVMDLSYDAASDTIYASGNTLSADFPAVSCPGGAADCLFQNGEGFVTRLDSGLTTFLGGTFIGGSSGGNGIEEARALALGPAGEVFVAGVTASPDLAVITGSDVTMTGPKEGFVIQLTPGLDAFAAATFLGGGGEEQVTNIERFDEMSGYSIFAAGWTTSAGFPGVSGASADSTIAGREAFVARLTPALTILGATYIGGGGTEYSDGLAVAPGPSGAVYLLGSTFSNTIPGVDGSSPDSTTSGHEMFLVRFNPNLTQVVAATFLGGNDLEWGGGITLDPALGDTSDVWVGGMTHSFDFPAINNGSADSTLGPGDTVIARLTPNLQQVWIFHWAELAKLLAELFADPGDPPQPLVSTLAHIERAGRAQHWGVAIDATRHFIRTLERMNRRNGRISPDALRRLSEMAHGLIGDLLAAERDASQGLGTRPRPRPTDPPRTTLDACPASLPPPRP